MREMVSRYLAGSGSQLRCREVKFMLAFEMIYQLLWDVRGDYTGVEGGQRPGERAMGRETVAPQITCGRRSPLTRAVR
jgi:hypothetical protein